MSLGFHSGEPVLAAVLIIDDNEEIRTLWTDELEDEGHSVIQAEFGVVGVKLARAHPVDVIVTEIMMPDKDGLETIIEIQSHNPTAKINALSGGGDMLKQSFLPVAGALGAIMTLNKPVDINEFCEVVSTLAAA